MRKLFWWAIGIAILCMMFGKDNVKNGANAVIDGVDKGSKIIADHVDTDGIKNELGNQVKNGSGFLGDIADKLQK